jgi:hypothetical protein
MKNRRYFTCPIQALYMMKEFRVKFEMRHTPEQIRDCDLQEEDIFYPFDHLDIRQPEHIESLVEEFENVKKIYVSLESEAIFEQKKGDIGIQQDNGYLAIAEAQEFEDFEATDGSISPSHYWKIIMRDNKHFFMGELENETQN